MLDFMRRSLSRKQKQLQDAIRKSVGRCEICSGDLDDHYYLDIGSATIGSPQEKNLAKEVESYNWTEASSYQNANALQDVRVWRAIRCPAGRVAVFPVVLAYDIWDEDETDRPIVLNEAESERFMTIVGNRWKPL